jgi:hypothetical protein
VEGKAVSYRQNDPDRRVEELEGELAAERAKKHEKKKKNLEKLVQNVFRVTHELAWRLGLVILVYGLFSTFESCGPPPYLVNEVHSHLTSPVWSWKTGVAIWTFGAVAFGSKMIRWMRSW